MVSKLKVVVACKQRCDLGEGAIWCPLTNRLLWIDIPKGDIYRYDPKDKTYTTVTAPQPIGTVVPHTQTTVVAAVSKGICVVDISSGEVVEQIADPEADNPKTRWNDGKVCPGDGRLWVGSMGILKEPKIGTLYSITRDACVGALKDLTISNGICWNAECSTMYHIDTPDRVVCSFDYDKETGEIKNKKVCIRIPDGMGNPDGCTMDNEGMIWVALFNGSGVARFDPNTDKLLKFIKVPAKQCTSVAFGGENLDRLYITTACEGYDAKTKKKEKKAGMLFEVDMSKTNIRGVRAGVFGEPE